MPTATIVAPPASSWPTALPRPRGATHRYAAAMPGTTMSAAAIFVSNPRPTHRPERTSQRVRPSSSARTRNHSAATEHRMSSASGLLWREMATAIGVVASAKPATNPAARPNRRRTRSYTSATDATPISACGTSMLSEWKPKALTNATCTHSASGGLSTVITPAWSKEP